MLATATNIRQYTASSLDEIILLSMTEQLIKYQTFLQVARQCDENTGSLQLMRYDKLAASMV